MNEKRITVIKSIISIIFGLAVIFLYTETVSIAILAISIYLIIDGLIELVFAFTQSSKSKSLVAGAVSLFVGLLLLFNSQFSIAVLVYIIAAKFLLESGSHIYHLFKDNKFDLNKDQVIEVLKNLVVFLISIWLIFRPITNFSTLIQLIGIYALISGLVHLFKSRIEFVNLIKGISIREMWNGSKPYIVSGLGYGVGFLVGTIITAVIFNLDDEFYLSTFRESGRLIAGGVVIALIIIVQSVLAGGLGTFIFNRFSGVEVISFRRLLTRTVLGISIAGLLLIVPVVLSIFLIAFHTDSEFGVVQSIFLMTIFGALYGLISSVIQTYKVVTDQRKVDVIAFMSIGYAIGGGILGFSLDQFFNNSSINYESYSGLLWLLLGTTAFGFAGGVSLYRSLHLISKPVQKKTLTRKTELSSIWGNFTQSDVFTHRTFKRFFGIMILLILGVGLLFAYILNRPDLGSKLEVATIGTAWEEIGDDFKDSTFRRSSEAKSFKASCVDGLLEAEGNLGRDLSSKIYDFPRCITDSEVVTFVDSQEVEHLVWISNQIEDINGNINQKTAIYDSTYVEDKFTTPILVDVSNATLLQGAYTDGESTIVRWERKNNSTKSKLLRPYKCDIDKLEGLIASAVSEAQGFHDEDYPFCGNNFESIIYTPNPLPEFSNEEPRENGAYDYLADAIANAQYEVLITNMWYDQDLNQDSPGNYISRGVQRLYENVQANPEKYPRGVNVKIMLGNPPEFLLLDTEGQIWNLLTDLRNVGFGNLVQDDIGWKVEVANFGGALPHSHTKQVIIDGDEVIAAGFNVTYKHLPVDHISKKGGDVVDNAIHVTGPVAQISVASFDDMWSGSEKVHCDNFTPIPSDAWQLTCYNETATVEHIPEVLTYKTPERGKDDVALSLYRSSKYVEADDVFEVSLRNAKESIDIIQVNYAMDMICALNVLVQVCDYENSQIYTKAFVEAMEKEDVKVRLITKKEPIEGLENKVALDALMIELEERGLSENFEVRYFDGSFHSKAVNIDDELLFIGSQNFHYSAWGKGGLTEFNVATDNSDAIDEFNKFYEYYWERSIPFETD